MSHSACKNRRRCTPTEPFKRQWTRGEEVEKGGGGWRSTGSSGTGRCKSSSSTRTGAVAAPVGGGTLYTRWVISRLCQGV
eukprot:2657607-Pyramimonas_sp.AAC.1